MTTMSDDGDRTCPLCAEEMDLTDQQLKPCKCGYEICVWCWHQINDMAEKEETEGRCPACRTPYDKERIVRMAANCERLVAEVNAEKKQKSQKSKLKISAEARKHLSSVRVVQRNLVYIIGLPTNLCDESILERKEYFGQYGKIIKVSLSRSGSAPSQQTPSSNTFSVYVTYAREEEAIRCIQAVHNYVLEGKALRACFGTTKYCHAWLRNMTCSNPDCLYLHDIGSQEDSFTKDEVISAYTRSRVPQVASNNSQQRSGNVLPPPADDLSSSSTSLGRNPIKSASNIKGSSNSIGKSTVLPAAASWGLRSSNCRPPAANAACSQPPQAKQKLEMVGNLCLPTILTETTKYPSAWNDELVSVSKVPEIQTATTEKHPSSSIESAKQHRCHGVVDILPKLPESKEALQSSDISRTTEPMSLSPETVTSNDLLSTSSWNSDAVLTSELVGERKLVHSDDRFMQLESDASKLVGERKKVHSDDRFRQPESQKPLTDKQTQTPFSDVSTVDISDEACNSLFLSNILHNLPFSGSEEKENLIHANDDSAKQSTASPKGFDGQFNTLSSDPINDVTHRLCSSLSFASKDIHDRIEHLNINQHHFSDSESMTVELPLNNCTGPTPLDKCCRNELRVQSFDPLKEKPTSVINSKADPCDNKVLSDILVHLSSSTYLSHSHSHGNSTMCTHYNKDALNKQTAKVDKNIDRKLEIESPHLGEKESAIFNCHKDDGRITHSSRMVFKSPEMNFNEEKANTLVQVDGFVSNNKYTTVDLKRESSIISDILSLDVDPWDDSSNAVNSFARLIDETERQEKSLKLLNSLKANNSNQSRFSFARQESQGNLVHPIKCDAYAQIFSSTNDSYKDMPQNGISYNAFEAHNAVTNGNSVISDKFASTSSFKSKISAPPGFSVPNKTPPPGFLTHDRVYQTQETTFSGNHVLGNRVDNHYQVHMDGSPGDVEFIDPAILAVGKGRMSVGTNNPNFGVGSTLPSPIIPTDARLHLLKQHSLSSYQNFGIPDAMVDNFLPFGDAYVTSRLSVENHSSLPAIAQMPFQQLSSAQFLSQQWDGLNNLWNTGSNMGMSDPLRAERYGRNFYPSIEEQKIHFANGDIYNRDFRM